MRLYGTNTMCAHEAVYRDDRREVIQMSEDGNEEGGGGVKGWRLRREEWYIEGSAAVASSHLLSQKCLRPSSTCNRLLIRGHQTRYRLFFDPYSRT